MQSEKEILIHLSLTLHNISQSPRISHHGTIQRLEYDIRPSVKMSQVIIPNNETLTQRQHRYRELATNVGVPQLQALIREGDDVQEIFRSTAYKLVGVELGRKIFQDLILNYDVNMEVSRLLDTHSLSP